MAKRLVNGNLEKVWSQLDKSDELLYKAFEWLNDMGLTDPDSNNFNQEIADAVENIDISAITSLKSKVDDIKDQL